MGMKNNYRAYSMEYGTFVGLSWSALFLSYVYGVCGENALLLLICFAFCGFSLLLPFGLGIRLNRIMHEDGESLSYWHGLLFSFSMFMYACLLNGLIVYGYFELFDSGEFINTLNNMLGQAEIKDTYAQLGMAEQYDEVMKMLVEINDLSSFDKALLLFNNNFMWGLFLSFVVAIPVSWKRLKSK